MMNNVYNSPREIYSITGDMCYENKIMMNTTALPERPIQQPQTCVNIPVTGTDKPHQTRIKLCRLRLRLPVVLNCAITLIVAALLALLEFGVIPQTKIGFYCKDPKLSFLYEGETVSMTALLISCNIIPLVVLIFIEILREKSYKRVRISSIWLYYKEFLIGITLVLFITEVAKVIFGEPRPHFFDTCEPNVVACREGAYIEDYNCTNTRYSWYFINDASRSFPSGHASATVFVAFYCSYVVNQRLPTLTTGRLLKPFLIAILLTYSVFCSLTRITDRRHHWWDVFAGALLGLSGVAYSVRIVEDRVKERLKPSRSSTSTTTLLDVKNKDATSVCL